MPKVWNRQDPSTPKDAVYVGRPTIYGNPFRVGRDGTREEVIELYRQHLENSPQLVAQIRQGCRGRDVSCWCAPLPCHGDVILEVANA